MKIKLTSEYDGQPVGSVIDCIDAAGNELIQKGHIAYTDDVVKSERDSAINVIVKSIKEKENMSEEVKKIEVKTMSLQDVVSSTMSPATPMKKEFIMKSPAGVNETTTTDGGYLVSHDIYSGFLGRTLQGSVLYPATQKYQVGANYNGTKLPYVNVTADNTTSQPRIYIPGEGNTKTPTKLTWGQWDVSLKTQACLIPFTEEILQDKGAIEGYVMNWVKGKFGQNLDYSILFGTAASQGFVGIFDATGANFVVTPVAHANTWTADMVYEIVGAVDPQLHGESAWYMSGNAWAKIRGALGRGVTSLLNPIANQVAGNDGELDGYPVHIVPVMSAFGSTGDVMFGAPSQYVCLEKSGMEVALSKDFYFDSDQIAMRVTLRAAGAPVYATYTGYDGVVRGAFAATS